MDKKKERSLNKKEPFYFPAEPQMFPKVLCKLAMSSLT